MAGLSAQSRQVARRAVMLVRRLEGAAALLLMLAGSAPQVAAPRAVRAATGAPHVMLIVEENRDAGAVLGSPDAPYLTRLAQQHGLATAAYAMSHPSLPNYLELLAGSTQGVHDDGTTYSFTAPTLAGQLTHAGIGWRAYMEGMLAPCDGSAGGNGYAKKHDPFMYFASISNDPAACASVVPYPQLGRDLAAGSAPPFLWVSPNLCHDGHDCATSVMDAWLASELPAVLASSWFAQNGIVVITWDEGSDASGCCGGAAGGHIATVVVQSSVGEHRVSSAPVDHAGTLRTIETLYGLPLLGDAACACSGDLLTLVDRQQPLTWLTVPRFR